MPRIKLTAKQVRRIRQEYSTGKITQKLLAWKYGVTRENISIVVNRRTWKGVT